MLSTLVALLIVIMVAAVVVPLALCYLLIRQVRSARLRRRRVVQSLPGAVGRRGRPGTPPTPIRLRRQWASLLADAHEARARFARAVTHAEAGPLRTTLVAAGAEVDAAVAEAERLATAGDRIQRSHREVLAALGRQRRRRRAGAGLGEFDASLEAATQAQHASAERLAAASAQTLCQLQLVVARLSELTAHTCELTSTAALPQLSPADSVAERLFALREASAELEYLARA